MYYELCGCLVTFLCLCIWDRDIASAASSTSREILLFWGVFLFVFVFLLFFFLLEVATDHFTNSWLE